MVATYNFGSAYTNGVDPEQVALTRAVRSVSALFAKRLYRVKMCHILYVLRRLSDILYYISPEI